VTNETPGQVVFLLDDYHLIKDPSIHQALTFLLDHLPPTLHSAPRYPGLGQDEGSGRYPLDFAQATAK
jgi:hypothetical protein